VPLPSPLLCPRRTFLTSIILASTFTQDRCYSNKAWVKLSGLPREIERRKRALGMLLNGAYGLVRLPLAVHRRRSTAPWSEARGELSDTINNVNAKIHNKEESLPTNGTSAHAFVIEYHDDNNSQHHHSGVWIFRHPLQHLHMKFIYFTSSLALVHLCILFILNLHNLQIY
jgi:hypothetical protein